MSGESFVLFSLWQEAMFPELTLRLQGLLAPRPGRGLAGLFLCAPLPRLTPWARPGPQTTAGRTEILSPLPNTSGASKYARPVCGRIYIYIYILFCSVLFYSIYMFHLLVNSGNRRANRGWFSLVSKRYLVLPTSLAIKGNPNNCFSVLINKVQQGQEWHTSGPDRG